jgi:hypothetical protein
MEAFPEHAVTPRRAATALAVLFVSISALGCGKLFAPASSDDGEESP